MCHEFEEFYTCLDVVKEEVKTSHGLTTKTPKCRSLISPTYATNREAGEPHPYAKDPKRYQCPAKKLGMCDVVTKKPVFTEDEMGGRKCRDHEKQDERKAEVARLEQEIGDENVRIRKQLNVIRASKPIYALNTEGQERPSPPQTDAYSTAKASKRPYNPPKNPATSNMSTMLDSVPQPDPKPQPNAGTGRVKGASLTVPQNPNQSAITSRGEGRNTQASPSHLRQTNVNYWQDATPGSLAGPATIPVPKQDTSTERTGLPASKYVDIVSRSLTDRGPRDSRSRGKASSRNHLIDKERQRHRERKRRDSDAS